MKKVVLNNYCWYVDERENKVYENADKTGASFEMTYRHLTAQERRQLNEQLRFN